MDDTSEPSSMDTTRDSWDVESVNAEQASIGSDGPANSFAGVGGNYSLVVRGVGSPSVGYPQGPQAEYVDSENTTFVVYRGHDADPFATYYDHDTERWGPQTRIGTNDLPNDDRHGMPALAIDSAGTIYVTFGFHRNADLQMAKSSNAYDTENWTSLGDITSIEKGAYPSPAVDDSDNVWILYRTRGSGPHDNDTYPAHEYATLVKSTDGGSTWTDEGPIIDTTGHPDSESDAYVSELRFVDGNLHFSWTVAHGSGHNGTRSNSYHAYYDISAGSVKDLSGTSYGSTITWNQMSGSNAEAFSGDTVNTPKFAVDRDTVYQVFPFDNSGTVEWRVATWSGGSWSVEQVGSAVANDSYVLGSPRVNDAGDLEVHVVENDGSTATTNTGANRVGSYSVYTLSGGSWSGETIIPVSDGERGQWVGFGVVVPRNSDDRLRGLAGEWDKDGDVLWDHRLYAVGTVAQDPVIGGDVSRSWEKYTEPLVRRRKWNNLPQSQVDLLSWFPDETRLRINRTGGSDYMLQWIVEPSNFDLWAVNIAGSGNGFAVYMDGGIDGLAQDLSSLSLGSDEDGRLYKHNGNSSISADGGTTSSAGWYAWSDSDSEFKSAVQF
jgi:hypothetical protein